MDYKVVKSNEIIWCDGDDRYILVIRSNEGVIGLNYMQGDELEVFKRDFNYIDYDLTDFFNATSPYLSGNLVERISAAIWSFHEYSVLRDDRAYNNK